MSKPPILILLLLATGLLAHHVTAQPPTKPTYLSEYCEADSSDSDTEYVSNLKTVLVELEDQAFTSSFYNTSAGSGEKNVYGQYYCRGDIESQLCGQCIQEASKHIRNNCFGYNTAIVWYEECTLRYDNQSEVGIYYEDYINNSSSTTLVDRVRDGMLRALYENKFFYNSSTISVPDPENFKIVLENTMDRIINKAAYGKGSVHFVTGEGMVSESETVYCLAQCSPDLNGTQCEMCLRSSIDWSVDEWMEWEFTFYSHCQLRYSTLGIFYSMLKTPAIPGPSPTPQPATRAGHTNRKGKNSSYYVVRAVIPAAVVGLLIVLGVSFCLIKRKRVFMGSSKRQTVNKSTTETTEVGEEAGPEAQTRECFQFNLKTIEDATNKFSAANKLGQGGFGVVYQGILKDGQNIAVKRLSKNSGQGIKEFKTEVAVVVKLQHNNLVRLVGCCVDGEERLLVYEFLCNLSLDRFLFNDTRSAYLTWAIRHKGVQGIARGLHYLHIDSRVKIIHRDLKTSNILLDDNLEPKIADFGMAKPVKVDQTTGNTTKVGGTYGYMAPEYALAGRYSTKSDVYSFGVIILEILSGKRSSMFYETSHGEGLLRYAWRVWNEGAVEQLMDPILENNYSRIEAERYPQIGLLCVQDDAASRPPMCALLVMLNSNTVEIPLPSPPSHTSWINKFSSGDETREGSGKKQENESSESFVALSPEKDLYSP